MAMTYADAAYRPRKTRSVAALFRGVWAFIGNAAEPVALRGGDAHMLADLGLTPAQYARIVRAGSAQGVVDAALIARTSYRRI